jgi:hypothetical protein
VGSIGSATFAVAAAAASGGLSERCRETGFRPCREDRDDHTTELVPTYLDVTRLAVCSFSARYREPTLTAYTQDLRAFLGWCQTHDHEPLRIARGELEMYVRHMERGGYAPATVARRFGTVAPSTSTP